MKSRSYSTKAVSSNEVKRDWYIVDAEGKTLGRMISKVASVLLGKHKPTFTPNADTGDYVIIINSAKVRMTGNKLTDRALVRYTGYPGGQRLTAPKDLLEKNANKLIEHAVKGMLPKSPLGKQMFRKLFVYEGAEHPHLAQKPQELL